MIVVADTNVLVRVIVEDDAEQAAVARTRLLEAVEIRIPLPALCELVWVLRGRYQFGPDAVVVAIKQLTASANVMTNRAAVETGLRFLREGADFADGIIAHEGGSAMNGVFISFDRKAVKAAVTSGLRAHQLS